MRETGGELDFSKESVRADFRRDLRPQDLERNLSIVSEIVRQKDDGHSALTKLAIERVAGREALCEARLEFKHGEKKDAAAASRARGQIDNLTESASWRERS